MPVTINVPRPLQPKPLLITVVVHVVLLLLLLMWRFTIPEKEQVLPEMGMEVNLGTSADGSGIDQPEDMEDPAPEMAVAPSVTEEAEETEAHPEVERSEEPDAPSVPEVARPRRPSPRPRPVARPVERPRRTTTTVSRTATPTPARPQQPKYVMPGGTGRGGNSASANRPGSGEGNTTGSGDRGVPGGTPGASNYTGTPGSGTGGISHSISGRNIVAFPPKDARFREGGRVIVRVTVDREGNIVNKRVKSSTNSELSPIALRKLQQVRFNKSATAPEEQFGDITFVFKTRQ